MLDEIFQNLKKLSALHVVPYYKWTNEAVEILESLLKGVPYCLTSHGNVFIGENRLEDIKPERICLQAHLDHPGGILTADQQSQYLFAKYYGTQAQLLGYNLGVYEPGNQEKIAQLEVEKAVFQESDKATCLFFKHNQKLNKALSEKIFIIHHNAWPDIKDGIISNWNLDDLINCALIVSLMKREEFSDNIYGLLSINEEVAQEGIRGFLHDLTDPPLFFINLDVFDSTLQLKTLDDEPYQQPYGIRAEQSRVKLDQFLVPKLIKAIGKGYLAKIPVGKNEGHIMQEQSTPFMAIFLKIDHYHNGVKQKKFTAERLLLEEFSRYVEFVKSTLEKVREYVKPSRLSVFTTPSLPEPPGTIHLIDHVEVIKDIFERCQTFPEYLHTVVPKLRTIYDRYQIPIPSITRENFDNIKENVLNGKFPEIQVSRVYEWKEKILDELISLFDHKVLIRDKAITLVTLLLGNFNARHISRPKRILLSLEKIPKHDLDRVLLHELTHYLTSDIWSVQNFSTIKKHYYNEGLAVAVSKKLLNLTLAQSLDMQESEFQHYMKHKEQLQTWFDEYSLGNVCTYFEGNYHQYFRHNNIFDPFLANQQTFQRYGYVLSALETLQKMEEGTYYEHLFC